MDEIKTGVNGDGFGLPWAAEGEWRVVAYADGGYGTQRRRTGDGGPQWRLFRGQMPADVERRLCAALGVDCKR